MAYFYFHLSAVLRRGGVGSGLLLLLGLLSIQAHAASTTRPVHALAGVTTLLPPQLVIPELTVMAGATFTLPVTLRPNDYAVAATAFSVDYDETWLTFDPTDSNHDGLPDAVRFAGRRRLRYRSWPMIQIGMVKLTL